MEEYSQISAFGKVLIFLIMGIVFVMLAFITNKIIAPNKPNPEKNSSYECGEEVIGSSWIQFNSRFYVIALIFLLFDVEMVFIFPWAIVFSDATLIAQDQRWGWLSFTEMLIFISILLLGLVYVWRKKDLDWIKPVLKLPTVDTKIPLSAYQAINEAKYQPGLKNKQQENSSVVQENNIETEKIKPKFVPRFKKS